MVERYSSDRLYGWLRIGPVSLEDISESWGKEVLKLAPGEISNVIELPHRFEIVRLLEKRPAGYMSYEEALPAVRNRLRKENRRKKKVLDILISLSFIIFFPFLILTKRKFKNLTDSFSILFGRKTWVGFSSNASTPLPKLRKGIFSPSSKQDGNLNSKTVNRLNMLYAKDYSTQTDLEIVMKNV